MQSAETRRWNGECDQRGREKQIPNLLSVRPGVIAFFFFSISFVPFANSHSTYTVKNNQVSIRENCFFLFSFSDIQVSSPTL